MGQYGSVNNLMMDQTYSKKPEVGMGATIVLWTDRHAATVIEVSKSGKQCTIQRDLAERMDTHGRSDAQSWKYTPDPEGATYKVSLRKDGRWKMTGGTTVVLIGERDEYYDFSF